MGELIGKLMLKPGGADQTESDLKFGHSTGDNKIKNKNARDHFVQVARSLHQL